MPPIIAFAWWSSPIACDVDRSVNQDNYQGHPPPEPCQAEIGIM